MEGDTNSNLVPPVVQHLRAGAGLMERSLSSDIREEREDLREAVEQTLNVILDLGLNGVIRWVSPSWKDVVGTTPELVQGKPIADLLIGDDKDVFSEAVTSMRKDDSRSHIIRFTVEIGPASKLTLSEVKDTLEPIETLVNPEEKIIAEEDDPGMNVDNHGGFNIELEGQGIMVYDRATGDESHVSYYLEKTQTYVY